MYYDPCLAHYGVKGMKWGVRRAERKQAKNVRRVERAYTNAGGEKGKADYILRKGRRKASKSNAEARDFEKFSSDYAARGKKVRASITKWAADMSRKEAKEALDKARDEASLFLDRSESYKKKADRIATKNNINLGKKRIDELLSIGHDAGIEGMKILDDDYR